MSLKFFSDIFQSLTSTPRVVRFLIYVIRITPLEFPRSVCKFIFKQFLKWRDEKYERERREERHDRRYEYEEDKR